MKIEYKEFSNIEDLELEFFKELKELNEEDEEEDLDREIRDKFNSLFDSYDFDFKFLKVINAFDRKIITKMLEGRGYIVFNEVLDLKVGDIILFKELSEENYDDEYEKGRIIKVDDKVLNIEFLKSCIRKLDRGEIESFDFKVNILRRKHIKNKVKKVLEIKKIEEEADKKEKDKIAKKEEKMKEDYERESVGFFRTIKVNKNILEIDNNKVILKKNINKIFEYHYVNGFYLGMTNIIDKLIEKKENFTLKDINDNKIYDIKFEDNPKKKIIQSLTDGNDTNIINVNGVRIRKNKVKFVLNRINKDTTKTEIKYLNKLTGMKSDLFNLESIDINEIKVNIKFLIINEDNFKVDLFGVKKDFDWNTLKGFFFCGRSISSNFSTKQIIDFAVNFGLTKQDVYDYLKRVVMVNELNKENENEN